MTTEARLYI